MYSVNSTFKLFLPVNVIAFPFLLGVRLAKHRNAVWADTLRDSTRAATNHIEKDENCVNYFLRGNSIKKIKNDKLRFQ